MPSDLASVCSDDFWPLRSTSGSDDGDSVGHDSVDHFLFGDDHHLRHHLGGGSGGRGMRPAHATSGIP